MKFTLSWLKDHLDFNAPIEELAIALNKGGIEVEGIEDYAQKLKDFSLAYIKKAEKHPNADKLRVCTVETNQGDLQIVCGAHNARAGIYVIFAPCESYIPGLDVVLKKAAIRGVESNGMMVSEKELGISDEHGAIIELSKEQIKGKAIIGTPAAEVLGLNDAVIEISITPNRGDLLGVRGIARDLAALGFGKLKPLKLNQHKVPNISLNLNINNDISKRFFLRKIINIKNQQSPSWLKQQLKNIGLEPKTALVDITNFAMFTLNQPLHAYDFDKISNNKNIALEVDFAKEGTNFVALDEAGYVLSEIMPTININGKIQGIAGIKGGFDSKVEEHTNSILLEAAHFDNKIITFAKRKLNINSDAAYRFEREVDINAIKQTLDYATDLILEICGGEVVEEVEYGVDIKKPAIDISLDYIRTISGVDFSIKEVTDILDNLGFSCTHQKEIITATPPSYRNDIDDKAVVVAEIIRVYGLDILPSYDVNSLLQGTKIAYDENFERRLLSRKSLANQGFYETINMSFISEHLAKIFNIWNEGLLITNPISVELAMMRGSIIPSLVLTAQNNIRKGYSNLNLFEIGKIYHNTGKEESVATAIITGAIQEKNWQTPATLVSAWEGKKAIFATLQNIGFNPESLSIEQENLPSYYHPGKSASLNLGKLVVGYFGEIHPILNEKLDIKTPMVFFELFLDRVPLPKNKSFVKPNLILSEFMPIKRDFAFILESSVRASEVIKLIKSVDKKIITAVNVFDLYEGTNIEPNTKSMAVSVTLQAYEKTFIDEEIHGVSNKIIEVIEKKLSGKLRV
jgi:phenylalanyl-tRNA synthetase beta chain